MKPPRRPNPALGYLLAVGAAVMWGVSGVVARFLIGDGGHSPAELLFFRTGIASLILLGWLRRKPGGLPAIPRQDWPAFLLLGAIGLVANQGCYYLALSRVSVGYALLFQYTAPVMLMGYGVATRTERLTLGKILAAATALAGCVLMLIGQEGGAAAINVPGTLFALGSGVGFSFYAVLGTRLQQRYATLPLMGYAFLIASVTWSLLAPVWALPWSKYDGKAVGFFLYLAIVATILPFGLFLASLRHLEPSRSSLTSMLEPVVAAAVAWGWLGETLVGWQLAGGGAVLGGVLLLQLETLLRPRPLPSPPTQDDVADDQRVGPERD
jgi:drug/metabolite transporter (DMT)-like permease